MKQKYRTGSESLPSCIFLSEKIFSGVKNAPIMMHTEMYKVVVAPLGICTENKKIVINQKVPHINI